MLLVDHSNVYLLVVSVKKSKYVVTDVLMLHLALDLLFKHSIKPHVLTLSFLAMKLTKLDKAISMEILPLRF